MTCARFRCPEADRGFTPIFGAHSNPTTPWFTASALDDDQAIHGT
jgi:hypothetical protein